MSLKEQIFADMKTAMREKQASQLESIRMLRERKEVDDQTEIGDDDVLAIVQKQIKQSQDAIKQFNDGDRPDLAEKEQVHVDNLKGYLPEQLSDDEIARNCLNRRRVNERHGQSNGSIKGSITRQS